MMPRLACALATLCVLATLLAGARASESQRLDLLRLLAEKPWIGLGPNNQWDRAPRIHTDLGHPGVRDEMVQPPDSDDNGEEYQKMFNGDEYRESSEKRSALATALNAGRRRRQPTPALGKAVTPYVGVGVLNDVGSFFDSLRDNLETLASLSPQQRATLFQEPPTVLHAPSHSGSSGGGVGFRKLHALRPLRPTGNIRSFVEADAVYPMANHHDPGLLWTGLGRR